MSKIGIVLTVPLFSSRCLLKNSLLYRATLKWVERNKLAGRTAIIGDNPEALAMAREMGFASVIDAPRNGHAHDILQAADTLGDLAADGIVLAQVTSPYRESWLLGDVVASMESNPDKITRVCSRLTPDTGALHGFPRAILERIRHGQTDINQYPSVFVEQNQDNALDIDYPHELVDIRRHAWKVEQADKMHRPVKLPEEVVIIGSNASLKDKALGNEIDSHQCVIRVNHLHAELTHDVGTKTNYHFSKYPHLLEKSPAKIRVSADANFNTLAYRIAAHAVTPSIQTLFAAINDRFISTGLKALIWALHNGANTCHLYGFGNGGEPDKIDIETGLADSSPWVESENAILSKLQTEGLVAIH